MVATYSEHKQIEQQMKINTNLSYVSRDPRSCPSSPHGCAENSPASASAAYRFPLGRLGLERWSATASPRWQPYHSASPDRHRPQWKSSPVCATNAAFESGMSSCGIIVFSDTDLTSRLGQRHQCLALQAPGEVVLVLAVVVHFL